MSDLRCSIGWHDWSYDLRACRWSISRLPWDPTTVEEVDGFREDARTCTRCGRHERNISDNGNPIWRRTAAGGTGG